MTFRWFSCLLRSKSWYIIYITYYTIIYNIIYNIYLIFIYNIQLIIISKYIYIYIIKIYNIHMHVYTYKIMCTYKKTSQLFEHSQVHWYQQCITVYHMLNCTSCHKDIVMMTGRTRCFPDSTYYDRLASVRFEHS